MNEKPGQRAGGSVRLARRGARLSTDRSAARALLVPALLICLAATGCPRAPSPEPEGEDPVPQRTIQEVQEAHTDEWMEVPGVVGTAIGLCEGEPCIVVYAAEMTEEIEERIPDEVEGYRVRVEVTGPFRPRRSGPA